MNTTPTRETDCLIIGAGLAGAAYSFFAAERDLSCILLSAGGDNTAANSDWAQGGVIYEPDRRSRSLREDILKASAYTASPEAVDHLIHRGPELIENLLLEELDVAFDRDDAGNLKLTREGGHSKPRIIYAKDRTGHAILDRMTERLRNVPKVELLPHRRAVDLLTFSHHSTDVRDKYRELTCFGAYVLNKGTGEVETIKAKKTILATGGLGQIFERTTNQPGSVGSGIAMAYRMGARIMDVEYIQFHPTVLHKKGCPPLVVRQNRDTDGSSP